MLRKTAFCSLVLWSFASVCLAKSRGSNRGGEQLEGGAESKQRGKSFVKTSDTSAAKFETKGARTKDYYNYLPFGTGQFRQNKQVLGMGLAAAQAGSLALYFVSKSKLESSHNDIHSVMQNAEATQTYDPGLYGYLEKSEKFEKGVQAEAQFALLSFVGFYALGIIDAVYDPLNSGSLFASSKDVKTKDQDKPAKTASKSKKGKVSPTVTPERGKAAYGIAFARDF